MPTYEYQCEDCGDTFEIKATFQQKAEGVQPACPRCHSTWVCQSFRPLQVISNRSGTDGGPSGGCCPGGQAGSCG